MADGFHAQRLTRPWWPGIAIVAVCVAVVLVLGLVAPSTADGFGAAINLSSLNTDKLELPSWVSADDCELYFSRLVSGPSGSNYDLYVSTRGQ